MAKFPTYEEMAKNIAKKALDEFLYDGKSIREWMQIIASKDCISRQQAIERLKLNFPISDGADNSRDRHRYMQALADIQAIRELPSVTPQEPFINKSCVSSGVCEHDKQKVLDKIRAEIRANSIYVMPQYGRTIREADVLHIIDKYKAEVEPQAEKEQMNGSMADVQSVMSDCSRERECEARCHCDEWSDSF